MPVPVVVPVAGRRLLDGCRAVPPRLPRPQELERAGVDKLPLRTLFLAGERSDPDTVRWAMDKLGVPAVDHYWQTESGWPIIANCVVMSMDTHLPNGDKTMLALELVS